MPDHSKPDIAPGPCRAWISEIILLIAVVFLAYSPGFWNGFVYDDEPYVLTNPLVHGKLDLIRIFTEPYPPGHPDQALYRPLVTLSYFADHKLWGFARPDNWNGFHLTNTLFHALNACLLFFLLRRLRMGRRACLFSCLIFALHPALSEAVAWVVGRAELMGMSFGLLAILAFLHPSGGVYRVSAFFLWVLAMLCKEHWFMLPLLVALLLGCMPETLPLKRPIAIKLGSLAVMTAVVFWIFRSAMLGKWHPDLVAYQGVVSTPARVFTALVVLWKYVGLWLWPVHLSAHHDLQPVLSWKWGSFLAASWLFIFWFAWRIRPIFPWFSLAMGWFWIAIFLVSNLLIPVGVVIGERFLYLSSLFFAPALVLSADKALSIALSNTPTRFLLAAATLRKSIGMGAGAIYCLMLLIGLWMRLDDWRSNRSLWESAAQRYPQSLAVKALLSEALLREGQFSEAHVLANEALQQLDLQPLAYQKLLKPGLICVDATAQLGARRLVWFRRFITANDLARNFRNQEALAAYRSLIDEFPEELKTYEAIGDLYIRLRNPVAARQHFEKALRLDSKPSPKLWAKYGQVLSELGRKAEALMAYDESLRLNPLDSLAHWTHYHRGLVLADLGDYPAALAAFEEANKISPEFIEPRLNSASVLIHLKRFDEAQKALSEALKRDPKRKEAYELLEKIPTLKARPRK